MMGLGAFRIKPLAAVVCSQPGAANGLHGLERTGQIDAIRPRLRHRVAGLSLCLSVGKDALRRPFWWEPTNSRCW